ncbi:hypothetical protein AJ78_02576 [Emergomyces pasteurianus Ep9510]|uniref:Uncharacterized protein n=1 Tax=Emergomyces pasteurianus Ep9510 TaxID=1447872 RepID=A0A1J9PN89_9EURO|nr:hypothetical protein AJ78_02576 [Emergomyces pasteurianus Ep9510]
MELSRWKNAKSTHATTRTVIETSPKRKFKRAHKNRSRGITGAANGTGANLPWKLNVQVENAKAERSELLGINGSSSSSSSTSSSSSRPKYKDGQSAAPSNLAILTGEGYMEESGRHIPCLLEQCAHRFHRDYDL